MNTSVITRALTRDGSIRLILADTSAVVQQAHIIHKTSKTITAVLGRCLTAASIIGTLLKDADNKVTLQINGDGPAGK
jgi:molecular chaperone Hsp33